MFRIERLARIIQLAGDAGCFFRCFNCSLALVDFSYDPIRCQFRFQSGQSQAADGRTHLGTLHLPGRFKQRDKIGLYKTCRRKGAFYGAYRLLNGTAEVAVNDVVANKAPVFARRVDQDELRLVLDAFLNDLGGGPALPPAGGAEDGAMATKETFRLDRHGGFLRTSHRAEIEQHGAIFLRIAVHQTLGAMR